MKEEIATTLQNLNENVTILFAIESGSRAWGFESPDSDYDIRYVYHYSREEYLRLFSTIDETKEHYLEINNNVFDFVGWDIYKFLRLIANSNPSTLEWIRSPIIYKDHKIRHELLEITKEFSRFSLFMHYLSMAKSNFKKYIEDQPEATLKKYLYVLRSICAAIFIKEYEEFPPIEFRLVVNKLAEDKHWQLEEFIPEIERILKVKEKLDESENDDVQPDLKFWIRNTMEDLNELRDQMNEKHGYQEISKKELETLLLDII